MKLKFRDLTDIVSYDVQPAAAVNQRFVYLLRSFFSTLTRGIQIFLFRKLAISLKV